MSYWGVLRYIPWKYLEQIRKSVDKALRDPNQTVRKLQKRLEQVQNIWEEAVEILSEENREKPKMEYEPPDKTAVKLPELEDILSPPIPVNESQPWGIPKFGLTGIPSGISNNCLFQDKDGSVNTIKSIISKDRFKPLLPKLPVRIRGLEKLYQKIEPVKIDYGKYLIEPAEKTISGFIKPLGSGLKGGFLKTMLSFLPDTSKISLPLGNIGSSGFFKAHTGMPVPPSS